MSSEDEDEQFIGDEHGVYEGGEVVADLMGDDMQQDGTETSDDDNDEVIPQNVLPDHDDSIHTFDGHKGAIFSVAWHPTSDVVASGSADDRIFMWQVGDETGASTRQLTGHTDTVGVLAFNTSGSLLASGGLDGKVGVWDTSSGQCKRMLEGPTGTIEWLHWHPKGDVILAGSDDFTAWLWNAETGANMRVLTGHSGTVTCGQFTPDGRHVVTGGGENDCTLKVWDPKSGSCVHTTQGAHFHPVGGCENDCALRLWDPKPGSCAHTTQGAHFYSTGITALAISADSVTALTGAEDGSVCLTNIQTGRMLGSLTGHTDSVEAAKMSHMLALSATVGVDGKLIVWDNATLSVRATCQHPEAVVGMELHPSVPLIFTACLDGNLRCWDARNGSCLKVYSGHTAGIQALALNCDGSKAITGSDDNTVRIFAKDS